MYSTAQIQIKRVHIGRFSAALLSVLPALILALLACASPAPAAPPRRASRPNAQPLPPALAAPAALDTRTSEELRAPYLLRATPPANPGRGNGSGALAAKAAASAPAASPIDTLVRARLASRRLLPAPPCSDAVFVRRVYLDVIGTIPTAREVEDFLADESPTKRAELIDALLAREEFAEYAALRWCDVLRVKSEYPINLWPNAVQAYHRWVRTALRDGMHHDEFARALLTTSGSNFREPPVNFYRALQGREPSAIAGAVALTFLGSRIDKWPAERRAGMEAFFSRIRYKKTAEWKEEIVCLDAEARGPLAAMFPDGRAVSIAEGEDPRAVFADWLLQPGNPWFARATTNRVWSWLLGRGIIQEPDDIRPDNPPSNPELLAYLEKEFTAADFDLRHLYRMILNSQTYQQSSIAATAGANGSQADAEALFAVYPVRRLDAEVLIDAICAITGTRESYSSPIPEPFTFIPEYQRSIELSDASISSPFLELFGRPSRDTGLESERNNRPSGEQRLYLLNSSHIQGKLETSGKLRALLGSLRPAERPKAIRSLYLAILSRPPDPAELAVALAYLDESNLPTRQAAQDLAWALINSKEFLYRH